MQWHQLDYTQSTPRSRQIITPTPHHSIFTGWVLFLTPNQRRQITEGSGFLQQTVCFMLTDFVQYQSSFYACLSYFLTSYYAMANVLSFWVVHSSVHTVTAAMLPVATSTVAASSYWHTISTIYFASAAVAVDSSCIIIRFVE